MIFATTCFLIVFSILHINFLISYWPANFLQLGSFTHVVTNQTLYDLFFGLAVGTTIASFGAEIVGKRFLKAISAAGTAGALISIYFYLPIAGTYAPTTLNLAVGLGALLGMVTTILLARQSGTVPTHNRGDWAFGLISFLIVLNFLMLVAPSSTILPSGFETPTEWSSSSLSLKHDDSVAIRANLIFVTLRAALTPLVGKSILINNLVSMVLCALGISFLASGARSIGGTAFALIALSIMITDRWVLTAGLSGNLPVTLITTCGLLFFIATKIAARWLGKPPASSMSIFILVLATTLFAMYSYAAVRIPFIISIVCLVLISLIPRQASLSRAVLSILIHIAAPIILATGIVVTAAYSGDISLFKRDLLVSWPKESWRPHPEAEGLPDFDLIHNPDTPIWIQIARPSDGQNFSVFWNRSPKEIVEALIEHISNILRGLPDLFCLQPCLFFLISSALIRVISFPPPYRQQSFSIMLWAGVWLTAYLLVGDATAYRRGISFSAMSSLCGALYFFSTTRSRGTKASICACGFALCALRFPLELSFANNPVAKATMFTVCENGSSIRLLLDSPTWLEQAKTSYIIPLSPLDSPRENSCLSYAVESTEWRRIMPRSRTVQSPVGSLISYLEGLQLSEAVLLRCSPQSIRDPAIELLCEQGHPSVSVRAAIPIDGAATKNAWVVLTPRRQIK